MQAIGCDGVLSQGVNDEILCDGTLTLIQSAAWMNEEIAFAFMLGTTGLFATAFAVRLIRRTIFSKA